MTQKSRFISIVFCIFFLVIPHVDLFSFGFAAHRKINRMAVFTLPPEMIGFFKFHIEYLSEHSIDPDRRAHAVPGEAPRHYINIDHFGEDPFEVMPVLWEDAVEKFTEDTLMQYGVLPWHVPVMFNRLIRAFEQQDVDYILYSATHLGHYVADLCTPLHTTKFYNGRTEQQRGIHALWESRIVELYADEFNYFVGRASYIEDPKKRAWELIKESHLKVDSIYMVYDSLMIHLPSDQIYTHQTRGQTNMRNYSPMFSSAMERGMNEMVERQMRRAVRSVGDFWYTAWVDAGQPDLKKIENRSISKKHRKKLEEEEKKHQKIRVFKERPVVK
ncbi:MAG: zinc dependent phospholipase C family protein [Bacteroidota bacterium]